jgi:hypothetical protein
VIRGIQFHRRDHLKIGEPEEGDVVRSVLILLVFCLELVGCKGDEQAAQPGPPAVSISDERAFATADSITFGVTLSASTNTDVSVQYSTSDVTALSGRNFEPIGSGLVVIPAGSSTAQITIKLINDHVRSADKIFRINLQNATGATILKASGFGTILSSTTGPAAYFPVDSQAVSQSTGMIMIPVALRTAAEQEIVLSYRISGSAAVGTDFTLGDGRVTIEKGSRVGGIFIPLSVQQAHKNDRSLVVTLQAADGISLSEPYEHIATIKYDGIVPRISIAGAPTGVSNATDLNITISGNDIISYRYKLVSGVSCAEDGFSQERVATVPITDDISTLSDGPTSLCVVGKDSNNIWMSLSSSAIKSWIKSTAIPAAPSSFTLQSPTSTHSTITSPTFVLTGLTIGNQLNIFSDSCGTPLKTIAITATKMSVTVGPLGTGPHQLYSNQSNSDIGFSACVPAEVTYFVDVTLPSVVSVTAITRDRVLGVGRPLRFSVNFTKAVAVVGVPTVSLNVNNRAANYLSGSGTNILSFEYIPQTGDNAVALDYSSTTALSANSGQITDLAGNDAILTLPSPGAPESLSGSITAVIDTNASDSPSAINDGDYYASTSESPQITWMPVIDLFGSGLDHYEIAIGTAQGTTDVLSWLNVGTNAHYRASGLNLINGRKYYASIRAIDAAGNASAAALGDGWTVDVIPPTLSSVDDGSAYPDGSRTPIITWPNGVDDGSGVKNYIVAVGTAPGLADVVSWTTVDSGNSKFFDGLHLVHGQKYFASVKVVDKALNIGTIMSGDGWTVGCSIGTIYVDSSQSCQAIWPSGKDGDLTIESGTVVEIDPGSVHDYRNLTINAGGILRIKSATAADPWTQIGVAGQLILNGKIDATKGKVSAGTLTSHAVANDGTKAGEPLSCSIQQANGGTGGSANLYSGTGGNQLLGNGGGGASSGRIYACPETAQASKWNSLMAFGADNTLWWYWTGQHYSFPYPSNAGPQADGQPLMYYWDGPNAVPVGESNYRFGSGCYLNVSSGIFRINVSMGDQDMRGFTSTCTIQVPKPCSISGRSGGDATASSPGFGGASVVSGYGQGGVGGARGLHGQALYLKVVGQTSGVGIVDVSGQDGDDGLVGIGGYGTTAGSIYDCSYDTIQINNVSYNYATASVANDWGDTVDIVVRDSNGGETWGRNIGKERDGYSGAYTGRFLIATCDYGCYYTGATLGEMIPSIGWTPPGYAGQSYSCGVYSVHGDTADIQCYAMMGHTAKSCFSGDGADQGGRGGGGSGGSGGSVVIRYVNNWPSNIQLNVSGGRGGVGANAGQAGVVGSTSVQPTSYP